MLYLNNMKNSLIRFALLSSFLPMLAFADTSTCVNLTKNLSKGVENNEVLKLQQFLSNEGYLTKIPNGYFGVGTLTAVKKFQLANGISQVGSVGAVTRKKIAELTMCSTTISSVNTSFKKEMSTTSVQDVKNERIKLLKSIQYTSIPFEINDRPSLPKGYSVQDITKDYAFDLYGTHNNKYIFEVYLGSVVKNLDAEISLRNVKCEGNINVNSYLSSDICLSKSTKSKKIYLGTKDNKVVQPFSSFDIEVDGEGDGKIYFEFIITIPDKQGKNTIVILQKGVTFVVQTSIQVSKESVDSRNIKRQSDVNSIFGALSQFLGDIEYNSTTYSNGNFFPVITNIPKEICAIGASSCEGFVNLSLLVPTYLSRLPFEYNKQNPNGIGYRVSKTGEVITVSAQYPEDGKTIQISCNYKKGC